MRYDVERLIGYDRHHSLAEVADLLTYQGSDIETTLAALRTAIEAGDVATVADDPEVVPGSELLALIERAEENDWTPRTPPVV